MRDRGTKLRIGLGTRLRVRRRRDALDLALEAGVDPVTSRELALRAWQLTSPAGRWRLARWLDTELRSVDVPPSPHAIIPPAVSTLRRNEELLVAQEGRNRELLVALAGRLRSDRPLRAEGLARLRRLLSDPHGPAFRAEDPEVLACALRSIESALDPLRAAPIHQARDVSDQPPPPPPS